MVAVVGDREVCGRLSPTEGTLGTTDADGRGRTAEEATFGNSHAKSKFLTRITFVADNARGGDGGGGGAGGLLDYIQCWAKE